MLIGLCGPAGVGKDTVALMLKAKGFHHTSFAQPLYQALEVLGIPAPETREEKEALIPGRNYTWRTAAQTLGTEWARNLSPTFWIDLAKARYRTLPSIADCVVSDVRFEEEAAWVRSEKGKVVHIIGRQTTVKGASAGHASEKGVLALPGDYILTNDGDMHTLSVRVSSMLTSFT